MSINSYYGVHCTCNSQSPGINSKLVCMTEEVLCCLETIFKWDWKCNIWRKTITANETSTLSLHINVLQH